MPEFSYQDPFPLGKDDTKYKLLAKGYVSVANFDGKQILKVEREGLEFLANQAMRDVSFLLRPKQLKQWAAILEDPESSPNDRGVAIALLQNAEVAAKFVLPLCQDTGTATIVAKKGQQVWTGVKDEEYLSKGVYKTYTEENLRYSQTVPLTMYEEKNSGCNLPAQIDIYATEGDGIQVPVHGQRRWFGQQEYALPGNEGAFEPGEPRKIPGRKDEVSRYGRMPALPCSLRNRRHVG